MDLSYEEIEQYLFQIFSREKIVIINDNPLLLKYPSTRDLNLARYKYQIEYDKSLKDGFVSKEDMKKILKERSFITADAEKKLNRLRSTLDAQKVLLAKTTKVKANQDRIKKLISELEIEIKEIESRETSALAMTAEAKAEESKLLFLCWCSTYNFETNDLWWKTYDDFLIDSDLLFRQQVLSEFILFYSGIPIPYIRAIARSNLWRIRYITSLKTSELLFGIPTSEYTNDMLNLVYWSHYYQNIYDMMPEDQPSDNIIEDDEALDAYMEDYYKERSKDIAARKSEKKLSRGGLSAFNNEEVIVTRHNELYEDIDYDKPKESQMIKDRNFIKKRTARKSV